MTLATRCDGCGKTHACPEADAAIALRDRIIAAQQDEIEALRKARAALIDGPLAAAQERDAANAQRIADLEARCDGYMLALHNAGLPIKQEAA